MYMIWIDSAIYLGCKIFPLDGEGEHENFVKCKFTTSPVYIVFISLHLHVYKSNIYTRCKLQLNYTSF